MRINKKTNNERFEERLAKAKNRKNNLVQSSDSDSESSDDYDNDRSQFVSEEMRDILKKSNPEDHDDAFNNNETTNDKYTETIDNWTLSDSEDDDDNEDDDDECVCCKRKTGRYPFAKEKWFDKMNECILSGVIDKQQERGFNDALELYNKYIKKPGNMLYSSGKVPNGTIPFPDWSVKGIRKHCEKHSEDPMFQAIRVKKKSDVVNKQFDKIVESLIRYMKVGKPNDKRNPNFQAIDKILRIREFQRKSSVGSIKLMGTDNLSKNGRYYHAKSGRFMNKIKKNSYRY